MFHAGDKGWGVRPRDGLKKGTFISEYVGQLIDNEEATRRGEVRAHLSENFSFWGVPPRNVMKKGTFYQPLPVTLNPKW